MSEYQSGTPGSDAGASSAVTQAQEKVQETAQQASTTAARAVREQVETRAGQTSTELRSVAGAMRRSGHALHAEGNERSAKVVDAVVEKLESLAGYLGNSSGDRMLQDVERFGRRQPWAMIGAGLGLGFVASRFLKASSHDRFVASQGSSQHSSALAPSAARQVTPPAPPAPSVPRTATPQTSGGAPVSAR
jgi:hypothetical protein